MGVFFFSEASSHKVVLISTGTYTFNNLKKGLCSFLASSDEFWQETEYILHTHLFAGHRHLCNPDHELEKVEFGNGHNSI